MPSLKASLGGKTLAIYAITQQHTRIGRLPANDIVLNSRSVSAGHAVLIQTGSSLAIEDLGSKNGTFVGTSLVKRAELTDGDIVRIGEYTLTVVVDRSAMAYEPTMLVRTARKRRAYLQRLDGSLPGEMIELNKVVTAVGRPGDGVVTCIRRGDDVAVRLSDGENRARLNSAVLTDVPILLSMGDVLEIGPDRFQFVIREA